MSPTTDRVPLAHARRRGTYGFALAVAGLAGALAPGPAPASAQTSFAASVSPNPVVVQAGGTSVDVTVTTSAADAMREPIQYAFSGFPAGIQTGGTRTVQPPFDPETFPFSATGAVAPGSYSGVLTGTHSSGTVTVPVTVMVQAAPALPAIDAILPPALAAGTREAVLRITGRNLQPGGTVAAAHPAIRVLGTRVLSSTAAEVRVAIRPDAPPGPYALDFQNPDGSTARGATVTIHSWGSLSGPVAVTGVRILAPRAGQIVAEGETVRPRALLAVSGAGTIVGTWNLDGVPFERFTRIASGGQPVEVQATMPIPVSYTGEHRLELVLESPATLPPQGVSFVQAAERRSALQVVAPVEGGLLDPAAPLFRWSPVPGASGYEVEVRHRPSGTAGEPAGWTTVRRRVNTTRWRPEPTLVRGLTDQAKEFRVRAVLPGEVFDEPTAWRPFRFEGEVVEAAEPNGGEGGSRAGRAGPAAETASGGMTTWDLSEGGPAAAANQEEAWGLRDSGISAETPSFLAAANRRPSVRQEIPPGGARQADLLLGLTATANSSDVPGASGISRLQLSTRTHIQGGHLEHQVAGDASLSHDLGDPWGSRADSQNWLAQLGVANGTLRPEARVGFAPPSFLDGSELLGVFTSGGGLQGSVDSPAGRLSYYRSARLGAVRDPFSPDPGIEAAGYELATEDGRYMARATTLRSRARPVEGFSAGGRGEAYGILAAAEIHPHLHLTGEAAVAEFRPGEDALEDSLEEERDGSALRLSARGTRGTVGYSATLSRTESGFVNPANPGFTPSGIGNRSRGELSLNNTFFGRAFVSGTYSHVRSRPVESLGVPRTTENGVLLNLSVPASARIHVNVAGNLSGQSGDAIEDLGLPETDRTQKGFNVSVTEALGRITLSQSVGRQLVSDTGQPWAGQQVTDAQLGAFGSVHPLVDLSGTVSGSRVRGSPEIGTTRSLLFSLQPSVGVGETGLRLAPRVAYTRSRNDGSGTDFRSTQLHGSARWTGPWETVNLELELSSDLSRAWDEVLGERPGFDRQLRLSAGLSWKTGGGW